MAACSGLRRPQSLDAGGFSRAISSVRSAFSTRSNSASNLALSRCQPVKSAASRVLIWRSLSLFQLPLNR